MNELTEAMVKTIKAAAKNMTGPNRRAFEAQVALDYLGGDSRLAETVFGWSRKAVSKGLEELRTGIVIPDLPRNAVRKTEEKKNPLARDVRDLVEPHSQADPKFQTTFAYTRITAKAVRQALVEQKGYRHEDLPSEGTLGVMLTPHGLSTATRTKDQTAQTHRRNRRDLRECGSHQRRIGCTRRFLANFYRRQGKAEDRRFFPWWYFAWS